jgi:hypothetical protein
MAIVVPNKCSRSQSESSVQSQIDNEIDINRSKQLPSTSRKLVNATTMPSKSSMKTKTTDVIDYFDEQTNPSNDQWTDWDASSKRSSDGPTVEHRYNTSYTNERRRPAHINTDDRTTKSTRYHEENLDSNRVKPSSKARANSRTCLLLIVSIT